jgi:hypothetical protein
VTAELTRPTIDGRLYTVRKFDHATRTDVESAVRFLPSNRLESPHILRKALAIHVCLFPGQHSESRIASFWKFIPIKVIWDPFYQISKTLLVSYEDEKAHNNERDAFHPK